MNAVILKNRSRSNISAQQLMDLAPAIKEADLRTTTEIILALPGETYQSHMDSLDKALSMGLTHIFGGEIHIFGRKIDIFGRNIKMFERTLDLFGRANLYCFVKIRIFGI